MTLVASRVVIRLSQNNNERSSIINPICNISMRILQTIIVTNQTTTLKHNSNNLCTQMIRSIVSRRYSKNWIQKVVHLFKYKVISLTALININ